MNKIEKILFAKQQLSKIWKCEVNVFDSDKNIFLETQDTFFQMVTFGKNAVIRANKEMLSWCSEKFWDTNSDETGSTALTALHHTIKTFSDMGIYTIVDHVLLKGQGIKYNITNNNSKEECADKIIELLEYPERFAAFKNLWSQQ